ncbi:RNA recognition motif domain containing [Brachionus plicatilis]|uniref:RNA recognition motif domain containing n=1 Tax=Brachionus plicatilis TaxID=10195 RepID=A0A3M7P7L9_BRAPC|nr:RNA recognition motif domain containing [Brachionus plicatilis]
MSNYDHKSRKLNENKRRSNSRSLQSSLENISDESRSPVRSRSPLERHDKQRRYKQNDRIHQNHHPNKILAIFGLDLDARKFDLYKIYDRFGCVRCKVIMNRKTGRSRGFGFVYFKTTKEAIEAKYATENKTILNKKIRIDYSMETGSNFYDQARGCSQDFYQSSRPIMRNHYRPEERSEPRQSYNRYAKSNSNEYENHIPKHSSRRYSSNFSERYHGSLFKRSRYS